MPRPGYYPFRLRRGVREGRWRRQGQLAFLRKQRPLSNDCHGVLLLCLDAASGWIRVYPESDHASRRDHRSLAAPAMRVSLARSKPRREDGQILVIFAGGLLVLMLIAALVIDLGFAYMVRRQEQDAVDPAAVAAARYLRTGAGNTAEVSKMWDAACFYALKNAFRPTQVGGPNNNQPCDALNPVDGSSITVNWPPSANAGPRFVGGIGFVEVILNRPHQSFFSGLIGMPTIGITSSAVGAFDIGNSNSNSLVA